MENLFEKPVSYLSGVSTRRATALKKEGIHIYSDFLKQYPFRYEDRSQLQKISDLPQYSNQFVQLLGTLDTLSPAVLKAPLRATFSDTSGRINLLWFQKTRWILKQYQVGRRYLLYGKAQPRGRSYTVVHPELTSVEGDLLSLQLRSIYRSSDALRRVGLHSQGIAKLQKQLLPLLLPHISDPLSEVFRHAQGLMPKQEALSQIHFPDSLEKARSARHRLCFEELFFMQLDLLLRASAKKQKQSSIRLTKNHLLHTFYDKHMPFSLTRAQARVIREIHSDMCSGYQMNRLLQGDVGSGKTMVAWMSLLIALSNDQQVALMAPTEVLASQHAALLLHYASPLGISVAKLSSSTSRKERGALLLALASGQLQLLVGTHALLESDIRFSTLGLVIIDEQHRFGVAQRALLSEKCNKPHHSPHILVMTATPIPRTLALTQYGELDVSLLDELPSGRKPIRTALRTASSRQKVYDFIRQQLAAGFRAYIVYPLIEESEHLDLSSLTENYKILQEIFSEYEIEQLHGRMSSDEKKYRMHRFVSAEAQVLVSTTVVEVGIDVPLATVMLIEHADRFGLAQLHQLRGRIGRGETASYCILMTEGRVTSEARTRLRALARTQDGFELAEVDLQQRGPGNVLGTQQSGAWQLEIADLTTDAALLVSARSAAKDLIAEDPNLSHPQHQSLLSHLEQLRMQQKDWIKIA